MFFVVVSRYRLKREKEQNRSANNSIKPVRCECVRPLNLYNIFMMAKTQNLWICKKKYNDPFGVCTARFGCTNSYFLLDIKIELVFAVKVCGGRKRTT